MLRMEAMKTNLEFLLQSSTIPIMSDLHKFCQDSHQASFVDTGFTEPCPKTQDISELSTETQDTLRRYLGEDHRAFKHTKFATTLLWVEVQHHHYKPYHLSMKDSLVHYGEPKPTACNLYGGVSYIHEIFAWPPSEPIKWLCIAVYGPACTKSDPFEGWPSCGAKLVSRNIGNYILVPPAHIIKPIAICPWSKDLVAISCPIS